MSSNIIGGYPHNRMMHKDKSFRSNANCSNTDTHHLPIGIVPCSFIVHITRLPFSCWTSPFITQHSLINHLDPSIIQHIRNICCVAMEHKVCMLGMSITFRQVITFLKNKHTQEAIMWINHQFNNVTRRQINIHRSCSTMHVSHCTLSISVLLVYYKGILIPSSDRDLLTIPNHQSRPS